MNYKRVSNMELTLKRETRTGNSTIGKLSAGSKTICNILEDCDRGLSQNMTSTEIKQKKVYGKTAIPTGRYSIVVTFSNRFKKPLPLLQGVPGFEGIRIHPGNTSADTEGCLLPGTSASTDFVGSSRVAFAIVFEMIQTALNSGEKVWITIQ